MFYRLTSFIFVSVYLNFHAISFWTYFSFPQLLQDSNHPASCLFSIFYFCTKQFYMATKELTYKTQSYNPLPFLESTNALSFNSLLSAMQTEEWSLLLLMSHWEHSSLWSQWSGRVLSTPGLHTWQKWGPRCDSQHLLTHGVTHSTLLTQPTQSNIKLSRSDSG